MEVTVVSRETIKPSMSSTLSKPPHKICLFDQLTPMTYIVGVLFYPISDPNFNHRKAQDHIKKAMSETLDIYYPFAGRNKDNLHVANFDAGIPFVEARVNCRMSEYMKLHDVDFLVNPLVPYAPFRKETAEPETLPLLAIQTTVFSCGGIAMGASSCHKNADGTTSCILMHTWAALCRKSPEKVILPTYSDASAMFPPVVGGLPERYSAAMHRLWFNEGRYVTRRFVFSAAAIKTLRERARSEAVPRPSRNDVVSCFIWKHATEASWAVRGKPRMSFAGPAVNVRTRMSSDSAANSVGNLFWWGMAVINPDIPDDDEDSNKDPRFELSELVVQMKEAMEGFERDFLKEVKEGREGSSEIINQLELMLTLEAEDPYIIAFTNWRGFFNEIDLGWGKPYWVGALGKVGPAFRNLVILVETQWGQGIEAFIALEAKEMAVLERDPQFLAFASPTPGFSSM